MGLRIDQGAPMDLSMPPLRQIPQERAFAIQSGKVQNYGQLLFECCRAGHSLRDRRIGAAQWK